MNENNEYKNGKKFVFSSGKAYKNTKLFTVQDGRPILTNSRSSAYQKITKDENFETIRK